jgi:hypothetical protein
VPAAAPGIWDNAGFGRSCRKYARDCNAGIIEETILTSILFGVFLVFYMAQSRVKSV